MSVASMIDDAPTDEESSQASPSFRELAESLPQMIWTCEPDGACDYLSPQWVAYTGIPAADQLGYRWLEQLHPDDVEPTTQRWTAALATGLFDVEFRIRRSDGVYRWFKTRAVARRHDDGRIRKWIGSNTDVQELRDAQHALETRVTNRTEALRSATMNLETVARQLDMARALTKIGSWQYDLENGQVTWSDELYRIFGLSSDGPAPGFDAQGALFAPASWQGLQQAVGRSIETGDGYEIALEIVRADGARRSAVARAEALCDPSGRVVRLVGTFQDSTEQELVASQLIDLTERLQLASSAARMAVWDWDIRSDVLVWDEAMKELYGRQDGTYEAWRNSLHPEDAERAERELADAYSTAGSFNTVFRICRPDGDIRHIRAAARTLCDQVTGAPARMIGVNIDITREHLADLAMRRSEALQRAIIVHAGAAIIATDCKGTVTAFSPSAEKMLGYTEEAVVGKHSPALWHDPHEVRSAIARLEAAGTPVATPFDAFVARARIVGHDANEWTFIRSDGMRVSVLLTVTPIRDDAGEIIGYLGVAIDLTERKRTERELLELNEKLAERSAQREVLLQEVHHRVKNNLQVIASLINMQLRLLGDEAARAALKDCQGRIRAIALIHELLYSGRDYSQLTFSDYIRTLLHNIVGATSRSTVELRADIAPIAIPIDQAIPLGLIANELITNAFKHGFPDSRRGTITLVFAETDDDLVLEVGDDGVGLPPAFDAATANSLGVRLVSSLARQLDARLEVTRAPTRFVLRMRRASGRPNTEL